MKLFVAVLVASIAVNFTYAQDDGRYRPELYGGDDGKYRPDDNGRYYGGVRSRVVPAYNPVSASSAYNGGYYRGYNSLQQPSARVIAYNGIDQNPYATTLSAVSFASATKPNLEQPRLPAYAKLQYTNDQYAKIVRLDQDRDYNGYHYLYQTDNGIAAEETGRVDDSSTTGGTRASGYYEYVGTDGVKYRVDYVADENGFQPRGAHLPS